MKYILLVACFIFYNCKKEIPKNSEIFISVNTSKVEKDFVVEDKLVNNKYIVLENTPNSMIGKIDKFIINKNKIYILDKEITKSLFVFSSEGKFLYKINNSGRGPGEYIMPDDFIIDDKKNETLILDMDQKKIFFYHKNKFVREKIVPHEFSFISFTKNNIIGLNDFCMDDKDCFKLLVFDKDFKIKEKLGKFKRRDSRIMWDLQIPMSQDTSGVYITEAFSNTIYKIDNQLNYAPFLHVDFQGKEISKEEKNKDRDRFLLFLSKTEKAFLIDNFLKNNDLIYFTFFYKQYLVHSFSVGKNNITAYNITNENKISFIPVGIDKTYLYSKVNAIDIIEKDKNYQTKIGNISKVDNPIIVRTPLNQIKNKINSNSEK